MLSFWPIEWAREEERKGAAAVCFAAGVAAAWSDEARSDWLELGGREAEKAAEEVEDKEEVGLARPGQPAWEEEDIFQSARRQA